MEKSLKSSRFITQLVLLGTIAGLFAGASVAGAQSVGVVPATPPMSGAGEIGVTDTTIHRRPRAIEYSDWYARRLEIHKVASYTELPLFAAEYYLGQKLLNGDGTDSQKNMHQLVAGGLGVLFTLNTVTGVWNLYESRQDPSDRKRKYVHSALMLASDAGFAWAGAIGGGAKNSASTRSLHKNVAIGSMGLSTIGTVMMWFWKD
jgi:hypothetical protein